MLGAMAMGLATLVMATTTGSASVPTKKWAMVNLTAPTMIAGTLISGPVMFLHDDEKMVSGEPCTAVYRFVAGKGPGEQLVAFHCTPRLTKAPKAFTAAIVNSPYGPRTLTEYQFAGDDEAHGVPASSR
jgi:hypothetical protein